MSALTTTIIDNSSNNDESDEDKSMDVFEQFLKYRKKKASRKKCTNFLVCEATRLIEEIQRKNDFLVCEATRLIEEIQRKNGGEPKNAR